MNGLEFKNRLDLYLDAEYKKLAQQREEEYKCQVVNHNHINSLQNTFLRIEKAVEILHTFVEEALKRNKKRWFRKSEVIYKEVSKSTFETFVNYRWNNSFHIINVEILGKEGGYEAYKVIDGVYSEAKHILQKITQQ